METKDSLTRDEAREVIEILALKEDNLENVAIVTLGVLLATISILVTVISIKYDLASDLIIISLINWIIIVVALLVVLIISLVFRFKDIDGFKNFDEATIILVFVTVVPIISLVFKFNIIMMEKIIIMVLLLVVLIISLVFKFKGIDEKAKKLAKNHNLEEFYNAILGKYK